jgi:hypothetical protein
MVPWGSHKMILRYLGFWTWWLEALRLRTCTKTPTQENILVPTRSLSQIHNKSCFYGRPFWIWCKKYWLILYTCSQQVFPITLCSHGPKTKWPRAQDRTLREYKKCPRTSSQGIFYDFPPCPSKILILPFLTSMAFLEFHSCYPN